MKNENGDIKTTDVDRANLLNDYFTSVFTVDDGSCPAFPRTVHDDLETVDFSSDSIYATLKNLSLVGLQARTDIRHNCLKNLQGA